MLLRVRRARLELGKDLSVVAEHVRVTPQALSRVENGREVPWPGLRGRLSEYYGIPVEELFADIDAAQLHLRRIAGRQPR